MPFLRREAQRHLNGKTVKSCECLFVMQCT